jgi:hypothetical protein
MIDYITKQHGEATVDVLAPTNVAKNNVNGRTLHSFFRSYDKKMTSNGPGRKALQKRMMKLRYIFVDEISMMHSWFWGKLCSLKEAYPHLIFYMSGDFYQLKHA